MSEFYVYTITSVESGEVLYVGKGSGFRWKRSLKRIEEFSATQCEVFLEDVGSNELALQKETKLIQALSPKYNKRVSWRKLKESEHTIKRISFKLKFNHNLVPRKKVHAGFIHELLQIGEKIFKLVITKSGDGFATAEFSLYIAKNSYLSVTTNATGILEPSVETCTRHKNISKYFRAASLSLQNSFLVLGYEDVGHKLEWTNLKFRFSTSIIDTSGILEYFTGICGRVERAKGLALGVSNSLDFKFKEHKSNTELGIKFYKQVNETNLFSIAFYTKNEDRTKLQIEVSLSTPVFYRGKARRFKEIFLGENLEKQGKNAALDIQKYFGSVEFLQDSEADTDTLRLCMKEMADQLGLPIIFGARHPVEVRRTVEEMDASEEERRILDSWLENKIPVAEEGMSKAKFYRLVNGLTERLGFRVLDVPFDAFLWIRMSLLQSMFTKEEHRELNLLSLTQGKKARIYELRSEASARANDTISSMKLTAKSLAVLGGENYGK